MSKYKKIPHVRYCAGYAGLRHCSLSSNGSGELAQDYFYWEFDAKPSTFSIIYRVLLIWDFNLNAPSVYVLNDELREVEFTKRIPHLYCREKMKLCLFYPEYNEFDKFMSLCETIIPWTYLWLQYYEEWLYSGIWKGGDAPHPDVSNAEEDINLIQETNTFKKNKKTITDKIYEKRKKEFMKN